MEIIQITTDAHGAQVVSAKELYTFLQIQTDFTDWCKRMFEYDFTENQDFNLLKFEEVRLEGNRQVKRAIIDYALTLSTAKEIAMLQRNDKGKQARRYFLDCEKKLNALPKKSVLESLAEGFAQMAQLEKAQLEQSRELKALQESQEAMVGKLHEVEAKITNRNEDFYSLAGYYGLKHKKWNLTQPQAQQTGKKLKKISSELGYDTLSVNDARYGAVRTYHAHILQTVLGF